jgi:hypothetical protein
VDEQKCRRYPTVSDPLDSPGHLRAKADGIARRVERLRRQIEALPSARTQEEYTEQELLVAMQRMERERLYAAQIEARDAWQAAGWPEDECPEVTALSPAQLDAERDRKCAENRRIEEKLMAQPQHVQARFRGQKFSRIQRDPLFRVIAARSPLKDQRPRERRSGAAAPRRSRSSSSSRTSGSDPGEPGEADPEQPSGRRADVVGRPFANFEALYGHLDSQDRVARFFAWSQAAQDGAYLALLAAERRRRAQEAQR